MSGKQETKQLQMNDKIKPTFCPKIRAMWQSRANAILLSGPVQSSKTTPILQKIFWILHMQIPNFRSLIVRTKFADINDSIISTLFDQLFALSPDDDRQPFKVYGYPSSTKEIRWDNGGMTAFRGVDQHRSKIMGSEWDLIFYNQIEDSPASVIPDIMGRVSGRAGNWIENGEYQHQFIADANPSTEFHHVMELKKQGVWEWYDIMHDSNPQLYDAKKEQWTARGKSTMEYLEQTYTGVEYLRKVKGQWKSADGLVYPQYDPAVHDRDFTRDDFGQDTQWYVAADFGGESPMACGLYAVTDGTKVLFKEIYQKMRTVRDYIDAVKSLLERYRIPRLKNDWVDHLTEHRNQWIDAGFSGTLADKDILSGIEAVRIELANGTLLFNTFSLDQRDESLKAAPQRLTDELKLYAMKPAEEQVRSAKPDHPAPNQTDHAADHLRYFVKGVTQPKLSIPKIEVGAAYYPARRETTIF